MDSIFSASQMVLDHSGVSPKAPPPTLEKAIQDLQNAHEDSVFACNAMLPDTKSRCNAMFSLSPWEIKATVQLIRHEMPPYTAEQATRISRLFLCVQHSLDTEYSSSIIAGLVDTPDEEDASTAQSNIRQPRLPPEPPRKPEYSRPEAFEKQEHEPTPERHDSLAPMSPPQSSISTAALRYRVQRNRPHSVHAALEFFAAKWEVLCSDAFRCIAYDTEKSRCQHIIEEPTKKALQDALECHVLKAPPMGILRPLLQQMLCWVHSSSEWLDAYHQKWAKHFLPMYRFGDGDGMTFLQTLEPGGGAFSFKVPSTLKVDRSCAKSTGSLKDSKKSSEGIQETSDNGIDKSAVNVVVASKNSKTDCRLEKKAVGNEELPKKAIPRQLAGEKLKSLKGSDQKESGVGLFQRPPSVNHAIQRDSPAPRRRARLKVKLPPKTTELFRNVPEDSLFKQRTPNNIAELDQFVQHHFQLSPWVNLATRGDFPALECRPRPMVKLPPKTSEMFRNALGVSSLKQRTPNERPELDQSSEQTPAARHPIRPKGSESSSKANTMVHEASIVTVRPSASSALSLEQRLSRLRLRSE